MDFKELKFEPVFMETSNTAASIMVTRHYVSIGHLIREKMGSSDYFQIQVNKENKILAFFPCEKDTKWAISSATEKISRALFHRFVTDLLPDYNPDLNYRIYAQFVDDCNAAFFDMKEAVPVNQLQTCPPKKYDNRFKEAEITYFNDGNATSFIRIGEEIIEAHIGDRITFKSNISLNWDLDLGRHKLVNFVKNKNLLEFNLTRTGKIEILYQGRSKMDVKGKIEIIVLE